MLQDLFDCQDIHFNNIKNGFKIYEGRPNKPKYSILNVGKIIMIKNSNNLSEYVNVMITSLSFYKTFEDMIEDKGLENVLPDQYDMGVSTKIAVDNVYRKWYNEDTEQLYGVLCIGVKVL